LKILSLCIKNINSFKENIYLDFGSQPLCSASLFAITGPTGSGKTTLLDAICVALYNKTPRLEGKGNRSPTNLLSQGTDEGFSEVVFQVNGARYLAEWRAKRKKKGDIKPEVKLIKADTGELITNRSKRKGTKDWGDMSVEDAVTKLLGMDFEAFRRSIILAQGEFASFLKADAEKKREILEATTGMDQYEVLKEKLNLQVRLTTQEYDKAEAGLEVIPAATAEHIAAARNELAALKRELDQLNDRMAAVEKKKEEELRRVDAYQKLEESRKHHHELLVRKDEIERTRHEIDRAYAASAIRSELDSYNDDKTQLERLHTELEKGNQEVNDAQTVFDTTQSAYETSSQVFEQAKVEAVKKRQAYNEAATYETKGKETLQEGKKKQVEVKNLNKRIGQLKDLIRQKMDEKSALEKDTQTDKEFLNQHLLPENVESLLAQASKIAAQLAENENTLRQRHERLKKADSESAVIYKELKRRLKQSDAFGAQRLELVGKIEEIEKAVKPFIKEGDEDYWHSIKAAWGDVKDAGNTFIECYEDLSRTFADVISPADSQQEFNETLHSYKQQLEQLNLEITAAQEKVKQCEAEEKLVTATNQAVILRKDHLATGSPCPVCGSIEHPWAEKPEPDSEELIEKARTNVAAAQSELEAALERPNKAVRKLAALAKKRVQACEERIQKIDSLTKANVKAENDLKLLDEKMGGNNSQIESLNQQHEKLLQEMDELTSHIELLNDDISQHTTQFFAIIPVTFSKEPPESALNNFTNLIQSVNRSTRHLEQNSQTLAQLKTFIQENSRHVDEDTQRYNQLLAAVKQYEDEGNRLLKQALELTGGLDVDAARSALDTRMKELEQQRDTMRDRYEQAGTKRTEIKARLEGLEIDCKRAKEQYTLAESKYMQALEAAGFESMEEHRQSFREEIWLEQKKQIDQQYQKDVHTVEANIKEHEAVFAEKPFNPQELQHILDTEKDINNTIQTKNSQKGATLKNISTLVENLEKRQQQEKKVEDTKKEMERWNKLFEVMPANSLRDFALKTMFDLLIRFANHQLSDITSRYALKVKDMKDMVVIDRWNAGEERPVETLSGGESFLVSLSLALALSELSSGRTQLESLFLDEGFGTLDAETLDAAVYALESLRLSGRTIGVISHVDILTRRIPVRIDVKKTGNGTSKIHVRG
jgi:exonuclease SbcC